MQVTTERLDELLEMLWLEEEQEGSSQEVEKPDDMDAVVKEALKLGLVRRRSEGVELTSRGREIARQIIRRHRLTEALLTEVMEMEASQVESDACSFEHILSEKATESVCTLLGHPPVCPHGKPIPRGECCRKFRKNPTPLVIPLTELGSGETCRIVFITPKSHARLDRLGSLGVIPGSHIKLHQKRPTYVIRVGETDVALDSDIACEIFVRRV